MERAFSSMSPTGHPVRVPGVCCFDFDGLLADTATHWARAYTKACAVSGAAVDTIDHVELHGTSVPAAARILSRQVGTHIDPTILFDALGETFRTTPPTVLTGVRPLLHELTGRCPLIVVTNGPGALVAETLTRLQLRDHFTGIVSADQVAHPKPAPDVYLTACQQTGVPPSDAVAFEDSPLGAQSAHTAGLHTIAVPDGAPIPDADLTVDQLDDLRVLTYLGLRRPDGD